MKCKKLMLCLGLCSLLIAGCTYKAGNEILSKKTQGDFKKELIKGKTTKAQVIQMYGKPSGTQIEENGTETFLYSYIEGDHDATNHIPLVGSLLAKDEARSYNLWIYFTKKDVVKSYTLLNNSSQKQGVKLQ
ncbi:MAG: hypothetical protein K2N75_01315 [Helicobacter sp.]|uniref:hypothetical protein n=1 Tax=Helicobacter sp. TaxID=218 RepID=UPI0023C57221|nr:hypothetical protein [Helicobacter sp.]MDE7174676.1 hypothetical protein [Helicobacter sp.]